MTPGEHGNDGWIGLAEVWTWIDARFDYYVRLSAGWANTDATLAEALGTGLIRARGFGHSHARIIIPLERSQPAAIVSSALGEIRVSVSSPARGAMMPFRREEIFREVEISEGDLASYCSDILGQPPANIDSSTATHTNKNPGPKPKISSEIIEKIAQDYASKKSASLSHRQLGIAAEKQANSEVSESTHFRVGAKIARRIQEIRDTN